MQNKLSGYIALLVLLSFCVKSQSIQERSIKKNISFLASDKLKGRGTSSPEELVSANYHRKV
jgi:hypothetical protein